MSLATEPIPTEPRAAAQSEHHLVQVDSIYRLIILAGLRSKQLVRGSQPRIEADPLRRKNTSIALEEIRQGLVYFSIGPKDAAAGAIAPE